MTCRITLLFCICLLSFIASAEVHNCENDLVTIESRFDGGDLDKCKFTSADSVELTFHPEDHKVDSAFAWFSFRLSADEPRKMNIRLKFPKSYARYWPKISTDGQSWTRVAEQAVTVSRNGRNMDLAVNVGPDGTWVSAQELVTQSFYDQWLDELAAHADIRTAIIGKSVEGRPIHLAKTANKTEAVFLLGRQHPAEVPGAQAMRKFIDVVLADTELAQAFRDRFTLIILPLINPDGVANGHSRHNSGRTDLNRDWGPFTQPETQSIANLLRAVDKLEMKPRLMLDFHATKMSPTMIFYTQIPEDATNPLHFATDWLDAVRNRIPNYEFIHDPRPVSDQENTKGYFFRRYGIPSITYEIGDEADRHEVHEYTPIFAEEMMRVMLRAEPPGT